MCSVHAQEQSLRAGFEEEIFFFTLNFTFFIFFSHLCFSLFVLLLTHAESHNLNRIHVATVKS